MDLLLILISCRVKMLINVEFVSNVGITIDRGLGLVCLRLKLHMLGLFSLGLIVIYGLEGRGWIHHLVVGLLWVWNRYLFFHQLYSIWKKKMMGLTRLSASVGTYGLAVTLGPSLVPKQLSSPCPTVINLDDPPLAHCSALPIPATNKNLVPLAKGTVQFKYVTPCSVNVVGCDEIEDSGSESAKLEFAGYVIGIENEFPSGIKPNIVGGFVVFPRSDDVEVEESLESLL